MSAVTNQPLPFGRLEREKHIQMILRAFQNRCEPSCECQTHSPGPKPQRTPPGWGSDKQLSSQEKMENGFMQPPEKVSRPGTEGQNFGGAARSDFMSTLETVSEIHIDARPELQGPQCVPRKIYSITTGGSRSQLFVAVEESSCVCLQCCGPARACSFKGFDCQGHQVFYFERPLRVDACCLSCCLMEMRVYTPQKHLIGTVCQRWSMFTPLLEVCDSEGANAIRIQGSCCPCRCFSNQQFQIVSNIGEKIGTIWKKWPGFSDEHNMDHEYFGLEVPLSVESHIKMLLLAATFLLNHMFFEMS
ncbi:phospholipid scramblase family member 5-like [Seriola lalandi dorsalis]|uniref:phospholipid scramblase family member 5-like n=1 Tax=Seriola lalandi dorsalis TaxID=1841481 RepID=UPI000C6FB789|nr:phospholipid scramblase family member 5-like [Seriola lalandi dorsalis]XP_023261706.1 phospholipid scramblase family member 5-like [Seriola lalandi dorsalis]XP_056247051.1 phospholipid scramblase family member 5 [Seriola aureovittata]